MNRRPTDVTGHACEHLVCFDLAKRGMRVLNNPFEMSPYDVIAEYKGMLFKVQVKGTAKARVKIGGGGHASSIYFFKFVKEKLIQCDLVAFVALDKETILYRNPAEIMNESDGFAIAEHKMCTTNDIELLDLLR